MPPNMPNLIHVFPQRQRDALFRWGSKKGRERERVGERGACINMLSLTEAIKECESFPSILRRKSATIFSRTYIQLVM